MLDVLKELLSEGRNDEVLAVVEKLVARNSELEQRLAEIASRRKKNESVPKAQLLLFLDALATAAESESGTDEERDEANRRLRSAAGIDDGAKEDPETKETKEPKKQPPLRKAPPPELRRIENLLRVPDAERPCPVCGAERECIGHDVTEVIELIPAEVVVRRDAREKLACKRCEGELVRAPPGDKVVSGGKLGARLVAQLLVDKYWDGLPLHRQRQRFERMGLDISVSTLADQVTWATDLLRPLWRAAIANVLMSVVMHLDGTSLPVLDRDAPGGKKLGTLWGYVGDQETALYLYASTGKKTGQKKGELGPEDVLKLRNGYTVADAAGVFDASFKRETLIECGCNMHARRYFFEALDGGDKRAALPIAAYKKLYEIEAGTKDATPEARLVERQARSKPVFDELVAWANVHEPHEPPSSPMGTAIRYLQNHHVALGRFLEDGVIPIDNGVVERLHVRAALTRKNFLFAGSDAGGERAAIAYTILGCSALAEIDPVEYLADVLPRLARRMRLKDLPDLLPAPWQVARAAAPPSAAE